ncbi:HNH endonuclease family protein [Bifidobacterium sp. SO1]|uniref:HNH endonuclease family protein n=1 Tax=Bifidobacterium sp. SO1 TaxID=2809029 RepID=UPI001BDD76AF|nr:HNH endonuclease family protein [Bifidobacterium sp. SO1]MBT1161766.1 HNH endonuclease [Bifidobacterium sp. SO1]
MGGKGGGPLKMLVGMIVTLFLLGTLMVALVSSGGWSVLSDTLGIGNPDATTGELTGDKGETPGNPNARPLDELVMEWFGGGTGSGGASAGTAGRPTEGSKSSAGSEATRGGSKTDGKTDRPSKTGSVESWKAALNATNGIAVAKARPGGYDRETQFGGWADANCGRATTRDTILARDMTDVVKDKACRVTSGTLDDPYTGKTITFKRGEKTSMAVQIDHVVSLQDAYASGARDWPQSKRVAYANDPDVLLASDGPANMAKGNGLDFHGTSRWLIQHTGAPDIWMPDNKDYRCDYMAKRASIKSKYGLSMTAREKQETVTFLAQCVSGRQ